MPLTYSRPLLTSAVLAALCLSSSAFAAQVSVYGRIDTGLVYQNFFGDSVRDNTFTMESGANTASRVGLRGEENLSSDVSVGFRIESRFASDTGELKGGRLFEGMSLINVVSKTWGELAAGRIAGVGSGAGPYDLQFFMDAFGGGTFGSALAPVKSTRMDNMIVYRTPKLGDFQATFQHSLKINSLDTKDAGEEGEASSTRYWSSGIRFNRGALNLVAIYEGTTWGHDSFTGADKDKSVFTLGGSYRLNDVTYYLQGQYFNGVEKIDAMSASKTASQLKGYGIYGGTQVWFGLSSWQSMVYWRDYKLDSQNASDKKGRSIGIATKYLYRPSKTIDMYVGAGYSQWDRLGSKGEGLTDKSVNVFTGITKYF